MIRSLLVVLMLAVPASAAELEDVPARMAVSRERMAVRKLYDRSLDKATAARLLADQAVTAETPLRRYAMLDEARRLATAAKDVGLTLQLIDVTGQYFRINVVAEKLDILVKQRVRTVDAQRKLLDRVMSLAATADRANDYKTVVSAMKAARTMAQRVRDGELVKTVTMRAARATVLAREWAKIKDASETLKTDPADPDANLQVGLFTCLFRKDWPRGLRIMAKGAESFPEPELILMTDMTYTLPIGRDERALEMAKIARVDLQAPTDTSTCTQLGDSWVAISKLYTGESRRFLLLRAGRWYAKAIATSEDDDRLVLEQRVARIEGVGWYGIPGGRLKEHHIYRRRCRSTATRLWAEAPGANQRTATPKVFRLGYFFMSRTAKRYKGYRHVWCSNADNWLTSMQWGNRGGWLFDEAAQELHIIANERISIATGWLGSSTKIFRAGLQGGKLILYNCRQDGVETDETALEVGGTAPVDLTK